MNWIVKTDVGVVRSENQDLAAVIENDKAILAILCDGMGGHTGGSYASQIAIKTFEREFQRSFKLNKDMKWFEDTIKRTKKEMKKFADKDKNLLDMGTTLTMAIIGPREIKIFNVGDSRTYAYNGLLHQITIDHNLRNHYINKFGYSPEEAAKIKGAAALTSALGPVKQMSVDTYVLPRTPDLKYIVLTCDGIHDYVSKPNFESILSGEDSIGIKAKKLILQGIKGKSSDNLTTIIVDLESE